MNTFAVAFNNRVEAAEAARQLGCAYSTVVALLAKKKLKGQKINRRWFVDFDDLQKAKSTNLIKTRVSRLKRERLNSVSRDIPSSNHVSDKTNSKTELRFYVDKDKVNTLQAALNSVDKSLSDYINERIDDLYERVRESLKSIKV
jgi:excisionase family DNA binding protein